MHVPRSSLGVLFSSPRHSLGTAVALRPRRTWRRCRCVPRTAETHYSLIKYQIYSAAPLTRAFIVCRRAYDNVTPSNFIQIRPRVSSQMRSFLFLFFSPSAVGERFAYFCHNPLGHDGAQDCLRVATLPVMEKSCFSGTCRRCCCALNLNLLKGIETETRDSPGFFSVARQVYIYLNFKMNAWRHTRIVFSVGLTLREGQPLSNKDLCRL